MKTENFVSFYSTFDKLPTLIFFYKSLNDVSEVNIYENILM